MGAETPLVDAILEGGIVARNDLKFIFLKQINKDTSIQCPYLPTEVYPVVLPRNYRILTKIEFFILSLSTL